MGKQKSIVQLKNEVREFEKEIEAAGQDEKKRRRAEQKLTQARKFLADAEAERAERGF